MKLALTEDQQMIRDAAETFLADAADSAAVRRMLEGGFDEGLWRRIGSELGWCGIPIAEEHGGLGLGPVEIVLVQEQMGRRLLGGPFFPTVCLAATLLEAIGTPSAKSKYLPAIATGELRASVALGEGDLGSGSRVPEGVTAELVLARNQAGVLAARPKAQPLETWDATRRFATIDPEHLDGERVDDPARLMEGLQRATALARLYIAAEQLGGAQQCLDSTVAHVTTRKQFGRAIGSFQAVKHRCAEMMVQIEATRSLVYGAAALAASGASTSAMAQECAAAKALASDTYFHCAQEAIQLHGGVGFTWEYDAQLHFKRAQASGHWLGTARKLEQEIALA
jgi:alkylation response protein AidB-like acyl-CoA dehydrogenase